MIGDRLGITQEGAHHLGCGFSWVIPIFERMEAIKMVQINGESKEKYSGNTVEEMIAKEGYQKSQIAVEINGVIVSKQTYNDTVIHSGDVIEVVSFVGGG